MAKKVVILDDDESITELTAHLLKKRGYQAVVYNTPVEALKDIYAAPPDLLIIDNLLIGTSGEKICHDLKNNPKTQSIKILLTSGQNFDELAARKNPTIQPADEYVKKPFDIDQLIAIVQRLLP